MVAASPLLSRLYTSGDGGALTVYSSAHWLCARLAAQGAPRDLAPVLSE